MKKSDNVDLFSEGLTVADFFAELKKLKKESEKNDGLKKLGEVCEKISTEGLETDCYVCSTT